MNVPQGHEFAGRGYTGGARGGFSLALQRETKLFSRTAYSAETTTNPTAPIAGCRGRDGEVT